MERYLNKPQADEPPINADPLNARHPRQHFRLLAFTKRALDFGIAALRRGDIDTSSPEGYTFYRHQATGITVLVVWSVQGARSAANWLHRYDDKLSRLFPVYHTGQAFLDLVTTRIYNTGHYPRNHYDASRSRLAPVLALTTQAGNAVEALLIRRSQHRGTSTNLRNERLDGSSHSRRGDSATAARPITIYFNPSVHPSVTVHHRQLREYRILLANRPLSEMGAQHFRPRNSTTGQVGSTLTMAQGRLPGTGRFEGNNYHEDDAYVNGVVELVSDGVVTPDEIRRTWSLMTERGRRLTAGSWADLLRAKKKADSTLVIRINLGPRRGDVEAFKRLQSAVLRRFAP